MPLHCSGSKKKVLGIRCLYAFSFILLGFLIYYSFHKGILLKFISSQIEQLRHDLPRILKYIHSFSVNTTLILFVLAVLQGFLPVIPFFLLAGASGVINGLWMGLLIIWSGATIGALALFILARYLARERVQLWLARRDLPISYTEEQGFTAILLARLIPVVPSVIINLAGGVSKVRFSSFSTATALGKLPWTFLYTSLGYNLSQGHMWASYLSIGLLGIFVLVGIYRLLYPGVKR